MKPNTRSSSLIHGLPFVVTLLVAAATFSAHGATLWTGTPTNFTQSVANSSSKDVIIPGAVELTRNGNKWLYNLAAGDVQEQPGTPTDTTWAFATNSPITALSQVTGLSYQSFDLYRNGDLSGVLLPNKQMVMHLLNEDIYIPVMFTAWPHGGGAFGYTRNTPGSVSTNPTVSITSPTNSTTFTAPVTLTVQATASVGVGSVTNVAFFSNGSPLGNDPTAPYSISTGSLTAGSYAYTAVATAAGISTTSSVVNITVVNPTPTVSITNPVNATTFAAPATFQIDATATVASGSVTNVAFFANGNPLGSDQAAPFNISSGVLAAGNYGLTAIATAAGVSSTSSVVNISVLAPGAIILSSPKVAAGQFSFDYTASIGLNYVVQNSANLASWVPLTTNIASSNLVHYIDGVVPGGARYYRVGQIVP